MTVHTIEEAIADLRQGKMIILVDDEDRENEGDLVAAAEHITPEAINFMATHGRGLICLALTAARVAELQIPQMISDLENTTPFGMAFTVSIEARRGVTTGISAADRATTIRTAVHPKTKPEDLVQPGHMFPLKARVGGVLERPGHTEGAVDLSRLAGLAPAGVLCAIMNDDGTMARHPDRMAFAQRFELKMVTIQALIRYRLQHESVVRVVAESRLPLRFGDFQALVLEHEMTRVQVVALIRGVLTPVYPTPVYIHSSCLLGDVFSSLFCHCGEQLQRVMQMMAQLGSGVLLYLNPEGEGEALANPIRAQTQLGVTCQLTSTPHKKSPPVPARVGGVSAQLLSALGVKQVRLMTNAPHQVTELTGYGVDIVERIPIPLHLRAETDPKVG